MIPQFVPKYDVFKLENTVDLWKDTEAFKDYLPILKETLRLPRYYVHTVLRSKIGDPYAKWVNTLCHKRNIEHQQKDNDQIMMDPGVAEALARSTHISGKYPFLALDWHPLIL